MTWASRRLLKNMGLIPVIKEMGLLWGSPSKIVLDSTVGGVNSLFYWRGRSLGGFRGLQHSGPHPSGIAGLPPRPLTWGVCRL